MNGLKTSQMELTTKKEREEWTLVAATAFTFQKSFVWQESGQLAVSVRIILRVLVFKLRKVELRGVNNSNDLDLKDIDSKKEWQKLVKNFLSKRLSRRFLKTVKEHDFIEGPMVAKGRYQGRIQGFKRGGWVDGRPYLLRGGRENALTKKLGNNFTCTCLRRVFQFPNTVQMLYNCNVTSATVLVFHWTNSIMEQRS